MKLRHKSLQMTRQDILNPLNNGVQKDIKVQKGGETIVS